MITANNKYSKIFGNYVDVTAYEYANMNDGDTSYIVASAEINSRMHTTVFNNSYNLYLDKMCNSYIKYESSAYTLCEGSYVYSYNSFDGFLNSYNDMINDIIVEDCAYNNNVCYVMVGKTSGGRIVENEFATKIALDNIDLEIDVIY